jgi:phosphoesterase RecJ-like protein
MLDTVVSFIKKHQSFILTTHDPADADGLGAELVFASILKSRDKEVRIVNASEMPALFQFMDPAGLIEWWDPEIHGNLPGKSALLIVDTSDEYNIGVLKNIVDKARDVIAVDHHEPKPLSTLGGLLDPAAAATCELAVELAEAMRVELDAVTARAAYTGLVYDTGFFAYAKTTLRTFTAAQKMIALGAVPYEVYRHLNENASIGAVLLQKRVFSTLELYANGTVAAQVMRKEDLAATGARFEDAEGFINVPMRAREIAVSVLVKETPDGKVRCSLRSKGKVNVSKIAQDFGGGGHVSAAGFRSGTGVAETLQKVIEKVTAQLDAIV